MVAHQTVTNPVLLEELKKIGRQEKSRWLRLDLPQVVQTKYGVPVRHISAPPDFFGTTSDSWRTSAYFFGSGMP